MNKKNITVLFLSITLLGAFSHIDASQELYERMPTPPATSHHQPVENENREDHPLVVPTDMDEFADMIWTSPRLQELVRPVFHRNIRDMDLVEDFNREKQERGSLKGLRRAALDNAFKYAMGEVFREYKGKTLSD